MYPAVKNPIYSTSLTHFIDSLRKNKLSQSAQIELIKERAYRDREFFASFFFPHRCEFEFSLMHQDFFNAAWQPEKRGIREAIAAPRGHAKTTFKLIIQTIHALVYGYEDFILIIGKTLPDAEKKVAQVLEELQGNPKLRLVYGDILPAKRRHSFKKFKTIHNTLVMASSRGQSLRGQLGSTGKRPSLIILDDIEALEETQNPDQRIKTRDWFFKDVLKLGQLHGKTNIIVIGTCLHMESLLSELLESPGWTSRKYQAILSYSDKPELWEQYRALLTNLSDPDRIERAHQFFVERQDDMLEGAAVLWPEGETYEELIRLRIEEGEAAFNSEKQNDPYDPSQQIFDMRKARRFRFIDDHQGAGLAWSDGSGKIVRGIKRVIAYHDPAYAEKPSQNSNPDYAAIVVVAEDTDGYLYVIDAWLDRATPNKQVEAACRLHEQWGFSTLYFEDNGSQVLFKQIYRIADERHPEGIGFDYQGRHQAENKYERISTLQPEIANGYLLFNETLNTRFMDQMIQFPTASHDDGPDALHGAVRQLKRRGGTISVLHPGYVNN